MSLQVYNYQNSPICFSLDGEVMVNATQMAKPFGKLPANFLQTQQTKDFITALSNHYCNYNTEVLQIVNGGNNPGTWMHQKLALKFAGWLSPEFELWVYDRIEELLTTGKTQLHKLTDEEKLAEAMVIANRIAAKAQQRVMLLEAQTEQQEQVIQELAPKGEFYDKVLNAEGLLNATNVAGHFGLTANSFNRILKERKIQYKTGDVWTLYGKYKGKGYTEYKPFPYTGSDGKEKMKDRMLWTPKGLEFLYTIFSPVAVA